MKQSKKSPMEKCMGAITNFAKRSYKVVIPVLGVALSSISVADLLKIIRYDGDVGYNETITAIMDSTMWPSDKTKAVAILKRDEDVDYYKAVISVVESSMFPSDKLKAIQSMSKTE